MSFCSVIAISFANINGFVLLYSFGNAVAIFATMFLMGPWRQFKNMFAPVRIVATLVFLGLLVATIVVAVRTQNFIVVLVMVILQFFAGLWYSLSYIPYGESMSILIHGLTCLFSTTDGVQHMLWGCRRRFRWMIIYMLNAVYYLFSPLFLYTCPCSRCRSGSFC